MDKLLEKYSLKEIEEKTRISPVALKKLFNYEFEGISKIKLKGFLKILKKEFSEYDFSILEEKANEFYSKDIIKEDITKPKKENNNLKVYFVVFILLVMIGGLIYYMKQNVPIKGTTNHIPKIDKTIIEQTPEKKAEKKLETKSLIEDNTTNENLIKKDENLSEENTTKIKENKQLKEINNTLVILPLEKVWLKVTYLDNFESKEYLTSHPIELNGSRDLFIKLGHGMETFIYKDNNLTPNTKKIVRIILKDGNLTITKKRISELK
jgi:hypothetical protein